MKSSWKKLLFSGCMLFGMAGMSAERPPEKVKCGFVESIPVEVGRRYIGKVSAVSDVSLVARVSGTLLKQNFPSGGFVKAGDLLFVIEDTVYKAAVDSAEARVLQCKAELEKCKAELIRLEAEAVFAEKELARYTKLRGSNAVAETVYDEAVRKNAVAKAAVSSMKASIQSAEASVKAAEAALIDAKTNLGYTEIRAPFNGKAGRALISPHNYVTPSSGTLVYIVSTDEMFVNFWITMRDYTAIFGADENRLRKEAHVVLMLADGSEFNAKKKEIVFVDNKVDKDTDSIRIQVKVSNENMMLIPDALVSVRISKKDDVKTAVPASAVVTKGDKHFVYVLDDKNVARIRPVVLGDIQNGKQIIVAGLKEGEKIVVDGTLKIIFGLAASEAGQPVAL